MVIVDLKSYDALRFRLVRRFLLFFAELDPDQVEVLLTGSDLLELPIEDVLHLVLGSVIELNQERCCFGLKNWLYLLNFFK